MPARKQPRAHIDRDWPEMSAEQFAELVSQYSWPTTAWEQVLVSFYAAVVYLAERTPTCGQHPLTNGEIFAHARSSIRPHLVPRVTTRRKFSRHIVLSEYIYRYDVPIPLARRIGDTPGIVIGLAYVDLIRRGVTRPTEAEWEEAIQSSGARRLEVLRLRRGAAPCPLRRVAKYFSQDLCVLEGRASYAGRWPSTGHLFDQDLSLAGRQLWRFAQPDGGLCDTEDPDGVATRLLVSLSAWADGRGLSGSGSVVTAVTRAIEHAQGLGWEQLRAALRVATAAGGYTDWLQEQQEQRGFRGAES